MSNVIQQAPAPERQGIFTWAGQEFGVEPGKVMAVLKATCFKVPEKEPEATDAEIASLLIVARAYNLNPFLREIFAFRDKKGGIVPVVGVDGWSRIINDKHDLDGIEFRYSDNKLEPEWIECVIYRKDRSHPTVVREYLAECKRDTGPWKSHTSRMLRHKALIQCARVAFGFAGIYDEDEAERIVDAVPERPAIENRSGPAALRAAIVPQREEQKSEPLKATEPAKAAASEKHPGGQGTPEKRDEIVKDMGAAQDLDSLGLIADSADIYAWTAPDLEVINKTYMKRMEELAG